MLFATEADDEELRILTYNVSISVAHVYALHIGANAPGLRAELLAGLWEFLNRCGSPNLIDLFGKPGMIDHMESSAAQTRLYKLLGRRVEMRKRYTDDILPRTLQPFAMSLRCEHKRDVVIDSGTSAFDLASEWLLQNSPRDRSALQFFEVVGLLATGAVQAALFVEGGTKRALARGAAGLLTTDTGRLARFSDRDEFLRSLT